MKIALGQINPTVGDFSGNVGRMVKAAGRAARAGAELILFPELALNGYPPQDLVEVPAFLERSELELRRLAEETGPLGIDVICGYVGRASRDGPRKAANCAAYLSGGQIVFRQSKMLLPTYDVFDEWRYFQAAEQQSIHQAQGLRLGITICEDVWNDEQFWNRRLYERDPIAELSRQGMDLLVNIASSPYHMHKRKLRLAMIQAIARKHNIPIAMVNQVGGNDQLIFDGTSFVVAADGSVRAQAKTCEEDLILYDTESRRGDMHPQQEDECQVVYEGLVLGTRDYIRKCGFSQVIVGLSGGIDSSVTAAIGVDAVGADNVIGVGMPGPYSSEGSLNDARHLAEKLKIRFEIISINEAFDAIVRALGPVFEGRAADVTEENLQARLRGNTLMALSNKFGALVLTTGNKSELAVGYCTLYGDMSGGLAVISDVPKTLVYQLGRVANHRRPDAIPESVFTKAPSAELRPGQKDSDSLPDYGTLDPVLKAYVEEYKQPESIAKELRLPLEMVREITRKVDRNEYKRKQMAPGLRVTSKAFGMGRRFPIAQRFIP